MEKVLKKYYLGENLANRRLGNTKKNQKYKKKSKKFKIQKKNEKDKNSKKLEKQKSVIDENLANRRHGSKKDFCQEDEHLVKRRLLHFMLHLAAHLLAFHAVAFMLSLSCFSFVSLMYPWITS